MSTSVLRRTLVFTDLVDSTETSHRLGDEAASALWLEHDRLARQLIARFAGLEIDHSDGYLIVFEQTIDAARFAQSYHAALATLNVRARIGLHVGPITLRENDSQDVDRGAKRFEVDGLAKPLAARVMSLAAGGQTFLTDDARPALLELLPAAWQIKSHGHYRLKGIAEPQPIFELSSSLQACLPPVDSEKVYRVVWIDGLWQPARDVPHNLTPERDEFIGRTAELRALSQGFDKGARLLTVVGPGGVGKTRLAKRYARLHLGDWPNGVFFCDLSEAADSNGICIAVALALRVPLGKDDPAVQLGHAIANRGKCLLVLDNFEQVIEHATATVGRWVDAAERAAFLVTSRELLQVNGEQLLQVEPLHDEDEAIALFTARAQARSPSFQLKPEDRPSVVKVVRLLDCLPLAIELAAARVRVLTVDQIAHRLNDRFKLLAGSRGARARQATLRAAIDWSWGLLQPWERFALAQCSVFEGGFSLHAAEAVLELDEWHDAPPVVDVIQALVDKSLLRTWSPRSHRRLEVAEYYFGMYLSIHEYAASRLAESLDNACQATQRRHGCYFAQFGTAQAIDALSTSGGVERRYALALEISNLIAACKRAIAREEADVAAHCYIAACQVFEHQGPFGAGDALGDVVSRLPGLDEEVRVITLQSHAALLWRSGRLPDAMLLLREALNLAVRIGDQSGEALVLAHMGSVQQMMGHSDDALASYRVALGHFRAQGKKGREGWVLGLIANVFELRGFGADAQTHYEAALVIHRERGDQISEAIEMSNQAVLLHNQGQIEVVQTLHRQALAKLREFGNRREEARVLGNLGNSYSDQGRNGDARAVYEEAIAIAREVGNRRVEGVLLGNLANIEEADGRLDEATAMHCAALAIHREAGNRFSQGVTTGNLGLMAYLQHRLDDACSLLEEAIAIHRELGARRFHAISLGQLGRVQMDLEDRHRARESLLAGEALLREVQDSFELAKLLCVRGRLEYLDGARDQANRTLNEAMALADEVRALPDSDLAQEMNQLRRLLAS